MSYVLNVNTAIDPSGLHKLIFNLPNIHYSLDSDGSGTFSSNTTAITMFDHIANANVKYNTQNIYLYSNAPGTFYNDISINPVSTTLSANKQMLIQSGYDYKLISHLLVISLQNTTNNGFMYFVLPMTYVNINFSIPDLDSLVRDMATQTTSSGYVNFNNILNDGDSFYYHTGADNTKYIFCQTVYFSGYLVSPAIEDIDVFNKLAATAFKDLGVEGSAIEYLKQQITQTSANNGKNAVQFTHSATGTTICSKIATVITTPNNNNFFINTLNYDFSADSDYDYVGCTVIDDGVNGTTPDSAIGYDPNSTKTNILLSVLGGAIISIVILSISPVVHWSFVVLGDGTFNYDVVGKTYTIDDGYPAFGIFENKSSLDIILFVIYIILAFIIFICGVAKADPNPIVNSNLLITGLMMFLLIIMIKSYLETYYESMKRNAAAAV